MFRFDKGTISTSPHNIFINMHLFIRLYTLKKPGLVCVFTSRHHDFLLFRFCSLLLLLFSFLNPLTDHV